MAKKKILKLQYGRYANITCDDCNTPMYRRPNQIKETNRCRSCYVKHYQGAVTSNWKGGISSQNYLERRLFQRTIQKKVFERDNYTCQVCQKRGVALQVDHIQPWSEYVEGRFSMDNCRTLCDKCHYKITFGREMPKSVKVWGQNKERRFV